MAATENCMSTASDNSKNAQTQVRDLAKKYKLRTRFFDWQEYGPVHNRIYSVTMEVGTVLAVGQAHSKKKARVSAAANILAPLKDLCRKMDLKPNGHLFEAAQANGWGFPHYEVVDSRLLPWGWLFTLKVSVQGVDAVGTGPTVKAAKQNAAAKMLEVLGLECPKYHPLIDKKDASTTPQVNQFNEEEVEEEDLMENGMFLNSETCFDQDRQDMSSSPDVIIEEIVEYLDEASVSCETGSVSHEEEVEEEDLMENGMFLNSETCFDQDMCRSPSVIIEEIIKKLDEVSVPYETDPVTMKMVIGFLHLSPEEDLWEAYLNSEMCCDQDCQDIYSSPDVIIEEIIKKLDEVSVPYETDPVTINMVTGFLHLSHEEEVEEEDLMENGMFLNSETCFDQDRQDTSSSPDVIIEEIVEYLDEASVPCETDPVLDSISLCEMLLETQTGSEEQGLCEAQDEETDPETNQTLEIVGPEMSSEPEGETEEVFEEATSDEGPVSDSDGPSQVLKEIEVFPVQEDMTPGSDQDHTPEFSEIIVQEEVQPSPSYSDANVTEDCTGPELSIQCEADYVLDSISLPEILLKIHTEVISEDSPVKASVPDGPPEEETEVLDLNEDMKTPGSDKNHTSEQDQGMSEADISSQKEPTSSLQILDGPPVACFLIRALVGKLVQKSICKPEDQAEVVRLLLEKTKDNILYQDVPISIANMRAVGKAAAKDLLKDLKLQGAQMSAEDEAFQDAMVKHLNNRLSNFLFGQKKKGLSRLCAAVGRFFCAH